MFFLYNVATTPASLMVLRFLHGVVFGFNSTAAMAIAGDKLPLSKMSEGMGIFTSAAMISMAIGPQISIMISNKWGFETLFIVGGCITLAAMSIALVLHDKSDKKQDLTRERKPLKLTDIFCIEALIPAIVSAFLAAPTGSCNTYMVLFGDVRGISNIGIYFTVYTLVMIVARPIIGKLSDKLPVLTIGVPCCLVFAGGMVSLWLAHSLIGVIIAAALCSLGYSICPMLQGLCVKSVPKERIGAASATYFMGLDVGNTVGPMLFGAITPSLGYANSYLVFTAFIAAGLLTLIVGYRKKQS
jgi:predicted MFS family arabinose efflux permease